MFTLDHSLKARFRGRSLRPFVGVSKVKLSS